MSEDLIKIQHLIGARIKQLRLKKGWTQAVLALHASLPSASRISEYERGSHGIGLETLLKLASALDVNVADLFVEGASRSLYTDLQNISTQLESVITQVHSIQAQIEILKNFF